MKILVLGSCRHREEAVRISFVKACEAIGRAAASAGHSLILCSQSNHTADPHCLRGAKRSGAAGKLVLLQPSNLVVASDESSTSADQALWKDVTVKICEGGWRTLHLHAIREADIVVAIGGSSRGTQSAIYSAELLSRPVVLIPTFGGAASECFDYFRGRYYSDDEANCLRTPWKAKQEVVAKSIIVMLRGFYRRYIRSRQTLLGLALLTGGTFGSLAIWAYTMFSTPTAFGASVALCLALTSASIAGSMVRLLARRIDVLRTEWAEDQPTLTVLLGLLVGFGLLLVGGFSNIVLNGKPISIDSYADARRIGLSLSPILFSVSLFLEQSWARLADRGLSQLRKT